MNKKQRQIKKRKKEFEKLGIKPVVPEIKTDKEIYEQAKSRKLPFQWIPKFHCNARLIMESYDWQKLSKKIRQDANFICAYCGESHPEKWGTDCHEEWEYRIEKKEKEKYIGTISLKSLKCVCKNCHNVCHPGSAAQRGEDIDTILDRYCKINNIDKKIAIQEFLITKKVRDARALHVEWELDKNILAQIESMYGIKCRPKIETVEF